MNLRALSLALAFLLVQFGGAWHDARQEHARCAEHGEWMDVASPTQAPVSTASDSERSATHGLIVEGSAAQRDHDHCVLSQASRIRAIVWNGIPTTFASPLFVANLSQPADDPLDVGFARYLLAPKHSPPC